MANERTGLNNLAYMGVEATNPPQLEIHDRAPTANDYSGHALGTIWIYKTTPQVIYMLTSKSHYVSTWLILATAITPSDITDIIAGDNIDVLNPSGPIVTVNLNKSISQPATSADGSEGLYSIDGNDFMHAYGTNNTFLGSYAGNRTNTSIGSIGIGGNALLSLTTGQSNTIVGTVAGLYLNSGSSNTALGFGVLGSLTTGTRNTAIGMQSFGSITAANSNNIGLGYRAGYAHTLADSSNICIGNLGTLGANNTIQIGTQGTGAGQQESCTIAGIYDAAVGATKHIVEVDSTGKLGASASYDGEVLISATGGSPVWATLTEGTNITITNAANSVTIASTSGDGNTVTWAPKRPVITGGVFHTYRSAAYENGLWLLHPGTDYLFTSTDPTQAWTQIVLPSSTGAMFGASYGNGIWVLGAYSKHCYTSPDGTTWTYQANILPVDGALDIAFGDGVFVVVGNLGQLSTSVDGVTWTPQVSSFDRTKDINAVAYGNGYMVAAGANGQLATSVPPFTSWIQRTSGFGTTEINDVAFGNGYWVAVGATGKVSVIQLPTDAWNIVTTPARPEYDLEFIAYGNNLWTTHFSLSSRYAVALHAINPSSTWTQGLRIRGIDNTVATNPYQLAYGNGYWVCGLSTNFSEISIGTKI